MDLDNVAICMLSGLDILHFQYILAYIHLHKAVQYKVGYKYTQLHHYGLYIVCFLHMVMEYMDLMAQ